MLSQGQNYIWIESNLSKCISTFHCQIMIFFHQGFIFFKVHCSLTTGLISVDWYLVAIEYWLVNTQFCYKILFNLPDFFKVVELTLTTQSYLDFEKHLFVLRKDIPYSCFHPLINQFKNQRFYITLCAVWYHLYIQKNVNNTHGGVLPLLKLQSETYNFGRHLNCTNDAKSRKASQFVLSIWGLL